MVADSAARDGAQHAVVTRHMTGHAAHRGATETTGRVRFRRRESSKRENSRRENDAAHFGSSPPDLTKEKNAGRLIAMPHVFAINAARFC
jgi:hypothetical protein